MEEDMKKAFFKFLEELKRDIWFFGGSGVFVGLLMGWQSRFQELGFAENPNWANSVFADLLSFNAFGLVFFGYLMLATFINLHPQLKSRLPRLESAIAHLETRLTQFASAIVSFILGFLIILLLYTILEFDPDGLKLIGLMVGLMLFITLSHLCAIMVGHRNEPFDRWYISLLSLVILAAIFVWLILQTTKQCVG